MQLDNDEAPIGPELAPKRKRRRRVLMRKRERELRLWHMRFGHLYGLEHTIRLRGVIGLPTDYHSLTCIDDFCVWCLHGKQKEDDHGRIIRTKRKVGDLWHVDITHHKVESLGKRKYTMCLVEHETGVDDPQFLRKKSDAGQAVREVIRRYQTITGNTVKFIQANGAKEFIAPGSDLQLWCMKKGITVRYSTRETPQENGVAENSHIRRGMTANTMRISAKLSGTFWAESERLAAIVDSYVIKATGVTTPYEQKYGVKLNIELIKPFGCHAFAYRPKKIRKKSGNPSRTRPCLYMGPAIDQAGYRCYDPFERVIFQQSSVLFDEYSFGIPELRARNKGHKQFMDFKYDKCDVLNEENNDDVYYDSDEKERETGERDEPSVRRPERILSKEAEKEEEVDDR
jgi:hypothetical protein